MWFYKDKHIESHDDLHPDCSDFVYIIHYEDGRKYIGKKTVRSIRRLKPTKAQLAKRKNYVRKELVNLPFVDYEGSLDNSECGEIHYKEIVQQCSDKRTATFVEAHMLFETEAVFSDTFHNKNILGKFFDNALDGIISDY